jgi:U3 small nucleolar RNA-associated protein 21
MLFEFPSLGSSVTCLAQSPVVDVIAIGLLDGSIYLLNIRTSQRIMQFKQDGRVTTISFRTGLLKTIIIFMIRMNNLFY